MEQWAKRQRTLYIVFSINAMPYAKCAMLFAHGESRQSEKKGHLWMDTK
jgi:hypothetical protein